MSRRRKKHNRDQVAQDLRDISREQEMLNRPVDPSDPLIVAVKTVLPNATNTEALEIALQLQKRLRGEASLLGRTDPGSSEVISKLKEKADKIDKAEKAFVENRQRFLESVFDSAPKLTEREKEQKIAEGLKIYNDARTKAVAEKQVKRLQFIDRINREPKETVRVVGIERTIKSGDGIAKVVEPEVVRIMDLQWVLPPGTHEVPRSVAEVLRQRRQTEMENHERERAMRENTDIITLQKKLDKISADFGSGGDSLDFTTM